MDLTQTAAWQLLMHELHIEGISTETESVETVLRMAADHIRLMRGEIEDLMLKQEEVVVIEIAGIGTCRQEPGADS